MQKFIYPELEPESRVETLAKLCLRTEVSDYSRTLADDEMTAEKDAYSRDAIGLASIEAEEKEMKQGYASKKKALKSIMEQRLKLVKSGKREVNGKLFLFADQQGGKMNYYDKYGELIISRPLRAEEKQTKLFIGEDGNQVGQKEDDGNHTTDVDFVEVPAQEAEPAAEQPKKKTTRKLKKSAEEKGNDLTEKVKNMTNAHRATRKKIEEQQAGGMPEGAVDQPLQQMDEPQQDSIEEIQKNDPLYKPGTDLPE